MTSKTYTFTFASGATGTNKFYVGPHVFTVLVASAMTNWNAGVGNASIELRYGLSETDTHVGATGTSITTMTQKGVFRLTAPNTPYMSVGFATAVTGGAANTIDVVVFENR